MATISRIVFRLVVFLFLLFFSLSVNAQDKLANYSFGDPGTAKFEKLGFWIKDGKGVEIEYYYGKDWKEAELKYLGKIEKDGRKCIKVQFKNGYELFISIDKLHLRVEDASGKYLKIFDWYYEGPRQGIGSFCEYCAEDERQSIEWMKQYFFK